MSPYVFKMSLKTWHLKYAQCPYTHTQTHRFTYTIHVHVPNTFFIHKFLQTERKNYPFYVYSTYLLWRNSDATVCTLRRKKLRRTREVRKTLWMNSVLLEFMDFTQLWKAPARIGTKQQRQTNSSTWDTYLSIMRVHVTSTLPEQRCIRAHLSPVWKLKFMNGNDVNGRHSFFLGNSPVNICTLINWPG